MWFDFHILHILWFDFHIFHILTASIWVGKNGSDLVTASNRVSKKYYKLVAQVSKPEWNKIPVNSLSILDTILGDH